MRLVLNTGTSRECIRTHLITHEMVELETSVPINNHKLYTNMYENQYGGWFCLRYPYVLIPSGEGVTLSHFIWYWDLGVGVGMAHALCLLT